MARFRDIASRMGEQMGLHVLLVRRGDGAVGYLVLFTGVQDNILPERRALVFDHFVQDDENAAPHLVALLEAAADLARAETCECLLVRLPAGAASEAACLARCGFMEDLVGVAKQIRPASASPSLPRAGAYRVRHARESDRLFFVYLAGECSVHTLLPGRQDDPLRIAWRYQDFYQRLPMEDGDQAGLLVCEMASTLDPVGFLVFHTAHVDEVTGEVLGYVLDIAVEPAHWGRVAGAMLLVEAEKCLRDRGCRIVTGDISAVNRRAIALAVRRLGYSVEWRRWMKPIA